MSEQQADQLEVEMKSFRVQAMSATLCSRSYSNKRGRCAIPQEGDFIILLKQKTEYLNKIL